MPFQRSIYSAFASAVCINREDRPDRRTQAEAEFQNVGITPRRFVATMHDSRGRFPTAGHRGSYLDHLAIIQQAQTERAESVLIMEDDVRFVRQDDGSRLRWLIENPWDMFFFYSTHGGVEVSPGILRIRGTMLAHCYAVHSRAFAGVISGLMDNWSVTLDNYYNRVLCPCFDCYATIPDLAKQRASRSNITRGPCARQRRA